MSLVAVPSIPAIAAAVGPGAARLIGVDGRSPFMAVQFGPDPDARRIVPVKRGATFLAFLEIPKAAIDEDRKDQQKHHKEIVHRLRVFLFTILDKAD